eukprot:1079233-Amorphochlora_amoeboformis.AAC.1
MEFLRDSSPFPIWLSKCLEFSRPLELLGNLLEKMKNYVVEDLLCPPKVKILRDQIASRPPRTLIIVSNQALLPVLYVQLALPDTTIIQNHNTAAEELNRVVETSKNLIAHEGILEHPSLEWKLVSTIIFFESDLEASPTVYLRDRMKSMSVCHLSMDISPKEKERLKAVQELSNVTVILSRAPLTHDLGIHLEEAGIRIIRRDMEVEDLCIGISECIVIRSVEELRNEEEVEG